MAADEKKLLYRRIVQQTNEQTLLARMRLHGFWPVNQDIPPDPADESEERKRIQAEIAELLKTKAKIADPHKALADERKRRWEASKKRRKEAKDKREQEAKERRDAWQEYRQTTIVHAGAGVSGGLQHVHSDVVELTKRNLPILHSGVDIAQQLGITLPRLRWLTYHRRGATLVHYHRYSIAKTGGVRYISAPKPALAAAQQWLLDNILARLPVPAEVHGFVPKRSIRTNAAPHVGKAVVINVDLREFFPSISFRRVKGLFHRLGYSEHAATVFALLCTEPPRLATEFDGKIYHVALGERVLPSACTSPAITNAVCRRLDRRLNGLAAKHAFTYTRYADDLTFSGDDAAAVGRLLRSVRAIILAEGFCEHPRKMRIMRRCNRQEVTGVVVNLKPGILRTEIRELRALLHNAARLGLASQNRTNHPNFLRYLKGRIDFISMIDRERGARLREALQKVS